jgi:hypothetical protein
MTHAAADVRGLSDEHLASPRAVQRRRDNRFYTTMGVVALVVALVGFNSTFRGTVTGRAEITPLVHLHGALFGAWLWLFIIQSRLIGSGRVALHRRLGVLGAGLALAMVVVGFTVSIAAAHRGFKIDRANDPLGFLVFPLGDLLAFTVLVGLAIWFRKRPMAHKRLMLLATAGTLMNAPLAHLIADFRALDGAPFAIIPPMILLLFASAVYDKLTLGRIHPVSLWGAIVLLLYNNLRAAAIGPSAAWHSFAAWLIG